MGVRLVFGVLGPLEVRLDGAAVRVGGPRQRALLGLLLCHANRVVSRDQLIEELLGDQPAATADRMLRVQVSRLRKALGDGNGNGKDGQPRLLVRPPGYLLRVEDGELDLQAFEQQVAAGRQALADGDPAQAAALLREAESLWRGRPLADLEFESFARLEVRRLETLRLQVIEDRIDAELAHGRHAVICPELEQLVAEHPLRERLRGQLMVALYRCGRQADALETYRAGRSLLVEELAVEPGPQLRKLQLAVLEQDSALDLPSPAARRDTQDVGAPAGVPADQTAPEPDPEAAPHPRPRRRTRRIALALGTAAALAALALVPLSRHGTAPLALNGNLLALVSAGDGAVQATVPLRAPPPTWRRDLARCGSPSRTPAWWPGSTRRGARSPPPSRSAPSPAASWPRAARSGCSTGTTAPWPGSTRGPTRWRRRSPWPASRATSCSAWARCGSPARATGRCCGSTPAPAPPRAWSARAGTRAAWPPRTARYGWRPTARAHSCGSMPGPAR